MKVGILSDTHNDLRTLQVILNHFRGDKITTIFHCGDVTSPDMIQYFHGFTVHLGFGNGDYLTGALKEALILLGTDSTAKRLNTLSFSNKQILIAHGNYPRELHELALSGRFEYIVTGHSHERKRSMIGNTRIINPGAASRTGHPSYSYALFDFENSNLNYYQVQ